MEDKNIKIISKANKARDIEGNVKKALSIIDKYLEKSVLTDLSDKEYINIMMLYAVLLRDNGELNESEKIYNILLKFSTKVNDKFTVLDTYRSLAFLYLKMGNFIKVKECIDKGDNLLKNIRGIQGYKVKANYYAVKGNYYYENGDSASALESYKKALLYAKKSHFTDREITLIGDIANIYIDGKLFNKAQKMLISGVKIANRRYKIAYMSFNIRLGKLLLLKGEKGKAKQYFQKAYDFAKKNNWKREEKEAEEGINEIMNYE